MHSGFCSLAGQLQTIGNSGTLEKALRDRLEQLSDKRSPEIFTLHYRALSNPNSCVINALIASGWMFDAIVNVSGNNEVAFVANHLFIEGYNPLLPYAHPERS